MGHRIELEEHMKQLSFKIIEALFQTNTDLITVGVHHHWSKHNQTFIIYVGIQKVLSTQINVTILYLIICILFKPIKLIKQDYENFKENC